MMKLAVVKTEAQYREYLSRIEELVALDPRADSADGEELALLSVLVGDYEQKEFVFDRPDPVEAVKFRMAEQDLRQVDLVPYFGSRSRVSEFLARQRPLTVQMIRNLSEGLGIPAEVLIQESKQSPASEGPPLDWSKFPCKEMVARGWISVPVNKRRSPEAGLAIVRDYIERAFSDHRVGLLTRRTMKGDAFSWQAIYALTAWQARVLEKAESAECRAKKPFRLDRFNDEFLRSVVACSRAKDGPRQAVEMLREAGVAVVIEGHLAKTKLDGAAMLNASGQPVVALTLRFDRVDNFWFTLMHECVHVWKHLSKPGDTFLDRLADKESTEVREKEANRVARDLLIPRASWRSCSVRAMPTRAGIVSFAEQEGIHPAIIAGRLQQESENYALFRDLIGQGEVGPQFV